MFLDKPVTFDSTETMHSKAEVDVEVDDQISHHIYKYKTMLYLCHTFRPTYPHLIYRIEFWGHATDIKTVKL